MTRVAVVTGVGAVSAFGVGAGPLLRGLADGRGAVSEIRSFDARSFPVRIAGEAPIPSLSPEWLGSQLDGADTLIEELATSGGIRDRKVIFALLAAAEAWRSAGCGVDERSATLVLAAGLEQAFLEDFSGLLGPDGRIDWPRSGPGSGAPSVRFRSPVDLASRSVRRLLGLTGPSVSHVSACAAGGLAVAHAASLIVRGAASVVLCGATDSMVNPLGLGGMWRLGAPSPRSASDACRPFDRRRDGLVIGEGAALFILEEESHARARGARIYCRILGSGSTQDAFRVTAPRPDGASAAAAMVRSLTSANCGPERVGYINAHGTGTPLNDPAECRAIRLALGAHADRVPVSSIKGAVGHLMAASGAIELLACLLAFAQDLLPGTANHLEPDPDCDLDIIGELPRRSEVDVVLSNSFGFGGQNVTLALGRPS